jgi:small nuclear ribonucleoprotein (snRNP)-like protein
VPANLEVSGTLPQVDSHPNLVLGAAVSRWANPGPTLRSPQDSLVDCRSLVERPNRAAGLVDSQSAGTPTEGLIRLVGVREGLIFMILSVVTYQRHNPLQLKGCDKPCVRVSVCREFIAD